MLVACSSESETRKQRCERLLEHVVELRAGRDASSASDPPAVRAEQRHTIKRLLGKDWVPRCVSTLGDDEIRCALAADDVGAVGDCRARGQDPQKP